MAKHTPTPWKVVYVGGVALGVGVDIGDGCYKMILNTLMDGMDDEDVPEINANAELIVRAVNSFTETNNG